MVVVLVSLLLANRHQIVDNGDSTLHMASVLLVKVDSEFVSKRKSNYKTFYQSHRLFHSYDPTKIQINFSIKRNFSPSYISTKINMITKNIYSTKEKIN